MKTFDIYADSGANIPDEIAESNDINIIRYTYINLIPLFGENGASCIYALLFVCLNWCIGYPLYKRKIYIKL